MSKRHSVTQTRGINRSSLYYVEFERFARKLRQRIQELRQQKELTQEGMQDFELNLRQFQRIESGETKNITLANLFRIAKAFDVRISELLTSIE